MKQLVTILASDDAKRSALLQVNDADVIGNDDAPAGSNPPITFADPDPKTGKLPDGSVAWKGTVKDSVAAAYPGAELHTTESLNARVADILVAKGRRVRIAAGLVTPDEKAKLDKVAADAKVKADAAATVLANAKAALAANADADQVTPLTNAVAGAQEAADQLAAEATATLAAAT